MINVDQSRDYVRSRGGIITVLVIVITVLLYSGRGKRIDHRGNLKYRGDQFVLPLLFER